MSRLIDADKLKDKLQQHHDFYVMAWGGFGKMPIGEKQRVDEITSCIAEVVNAPTIDAVEVVRGEWILLELRYPIEQKVYWSKEQALADTKGNGARERRKCSCCGYTKSFMCHMKDEQIKLWNFCPNCGADMRKGADDE